MSHVSKHADRLNQDCTDETRCDMERERTGERYNVSLT